MRAAKGNFPRDKSSLRREGSSERLRPTQLNHRNGSPCGAWRAFSIHEFLCLPTASKRNSVRKPSLCLNFVFLLFALSNKKAKGFAKLWRAAQKRGFARASDLISPDCFPYCHTAPPARSMLPKGGTSPQGEVPRRLRGVECIPMVFSDPNIGKQSCEETFLLHQQNHPLIRLAFTTSRKSAANGGRCRRGTLLRAVIEKCPLQGVERRNSIQQRGAL